MATHNDLSYVTNLAGRLSVELKGSNATAVSLVARHVARSVRTEIRGVAGADQRLSGARNARVGVKVKESLGGATPSAKVFPTGPIKLIEENTRPHEIRPRRRKGGKALKFAGDRYAAVVHHPGTRGQHPFAHGAAKGQATAGRIYDETVQAAIRRAL